VQECVCLYIYKCALIACCVTDATRTAELYARWSVIISIRISFVLCISSTKKTSRVVFCCILYCLLNGFGGLGSFFSSSMIFSLVLDFFPPT
jgi:uncharacterized membrane protein YesL